jgi:hypothetical protein
MKFPPAFNKNAAPVESVIVWLPLEELEPGPPPTLPTISIDKS